MAMGCRNKQTRGTMVSRAPSILYVYYYSTLIQLLINTTKSTLITFYKYFNNLVEAMQA